MNLIFTNHYFNLKNFFKKTKTLLLLYVFTVSSFNIFAQNNTSLINNCSDFVVGSAASWPYVLVATTIDSGTVSHASQTYSINITSLPPAGANVRVYKTVANGNDFFGNPIALTLGTNSITVSAVSFDRAVKFQFSSGDVEFDALSLNGESSDCVIVLPPSSTSLISSCNDFISGPNQNWPHVLVATTIDSGIVSQESQMFEMNVTSLPAGGANFRVYKTVANGNDFFGNPIALTLGINTITVSAVSFDRAVKFQFSSGNVEFDALSLNGEDSECIDNTTQINIPLYQNILLNIFPNPSNGDVFIESADPIELLEIKDLSGKVVFKMAPQESNAKIQTTQLKNSVYILSCFVKKEWISRKIIINKR